MGAEVGSDLSDLTAFIVGSFGPKLPSRWLLKYQDDEDDLITIGSDQELGEAIRLAQQSASSSRPLLRLEVLPAPPKRARSVPPTPSLLSSASASSFVDLDASEIAPTSPAVELVTVTVRLRPLP